MTVSRSGDQEYRGDESRESDEIRFVESFPAVAADNLGWCAATSMIKHPIASRSSRIVSEQLTVRAWHREGVRPGDGVGSGRRRVSAIVGWVLAAYVLLGVCPLVGARGEGACPCRQATFVGDPQSLGAFALDEGAEILIVRG